jgi:hypothetical protein
LCGIAKSCGEPVVNKYKEVLTSLLMALKLKVGNEECIRLEYIYDAWVEVLDVFPQVSEQVAKHVISLVLYGFESYTEGEKGSNGATQYQSGPRTLNIVLLKKSIKLVTKLGTF